MTVSRPFLRIALAALGLAITTPACAGDGSCPWRHLPTQVREHALVAGLNAGPAALIAAISEDDMRLAEASCGLTEKNAEAFHHAESGFILQILAEKWLSNNTPFTSGKLDRAWGMMDRRAKAALEAWANNLDHAPDVHERAYGAFMMQLGNYASKSSMDIRPKVITYLQGRALRSEFEPLF